MGKALYNGRQKVTAEQVKEIIIRIEKGESNKSIAEVYNISPQSVSSIKRGRMWSDITGLSPVESKKKLTNKELEEITGRFEKGERVADIAKIYNKSLSSIHSIKATYKRRNRQ